MNRLFAACLVVGIGAVVSAAPRQSPVRPSAAIEEMLWWLPAATETLMVQQASSPPMRGLVHDALLSDKIDVGDSALMTSAKPHLQGARLKLTLEGSRRFTTPRGLGEFPYEGVTIYTFMKPLGAGGQALMSDLAKTGMRARQVHGFVVEFSETVEDTTWTHYMAVPRPDALLDATNLDYLTEVLARIAKRAETRALSGELSEWRWVDVRSSFWVLRHYRREHVHEDPTSPFRKDEAGKSMDPDAVGMTAHAGPDGRTIVTHYLSKNATADRVATRMFSHPGDGVTPVVRRAGDDATELRFVAKDEDHLSMFVLLVHGAGSRHCVVADPCQCHRRLGAKGALVVTGDISPSTGVTRVTPSRDRG